MKEEQSNNSLLIVEDDIDALLKLQKYFDLEGYRVQTATDGALALDMLRNQMNSIDLIITDLVMPNVTGAELITAVKKEFPEIKIIAISGYGEEIHELALAAKAEALLLKPLDMSKLEYMVRTLLNGYMF